MKLKAMLCGVCGARMLVSVCVRERERERRERERERDDRRER